MNRHHGGRRYSPRRRARAGRLWRRHGCPGARRVTVSLLPSFLAFVKRTKPMYFSAGEELVFRRWYGALGKHPRRRFNRLLRRGLEADAAVLEVRGSVLPPPRERKYLWERLLGT